MYGEREVELLCPECAMPAHSGSLRGVLEVVVDEFPDTWPDGPSSSGEFLTCFLPVPDDRHFAPLAVGGTPLLPVPTLRRHLDLPGLWVKDDTRNPSGSTKDRASLLVLAKANEYGYETVATASTGNAATALAALAAGTGRRAVVFVPATAPEAKLVQMLSYGATVVPIAGSYDDAFDLCVAACAEFGWYNRNTAMNPFTTEGKKTVALEIARDLAPASPDAVVVPTGDGVILAGVAKGFADLQRAGFIDRLPRLIAVQPSGSAAIVDALRRGDADITPVTGAHSVADSLTVQAPRNGRLCLLRIRESGGAGVTVDDDAIISSIADLARLAGIFAEPAAAAALAGLRVALAADLVTKRETVVLIVTGTGLKDVPSAARAIDVPDPITADLDAVAKRMRIA